MKTLFTTAVCLWLATLSVFAQQFQVNGSKIYDPTGREFIMKGVNVSGPGFVWPEYTVDEFDQIVNQWGFNAIRVATKGGPAVDSYTYQCVIEGKDFPSSYDYKTFGTLREIVDTYTAAGVVVMLEWHQVSGLYTGSELECAKDWWQSMAEAFKDNPYVWFDLYNEPRTDSTTWLNSFQQVIDAIRSTGSENVIVATGNYWGQDAGVWDCVDVPEANSAVLSLGGQLNDPTGNLVFSFHVYDQWNACQAKIDNYLDRVLADNKAIILGEYGVHNAGQDVSDAATYALNSAQPREIGRVTWAWWGGDRNDLTTSNNGGGQHTTFNSEGQPTNLSAFGQMVWSDLRREENIDRIPTDEVLTLSLDDLSFEPEEGSRTVNVISNVNWTVEVDQSWIRVTPGSGSDNGSFVVSVTPNDRRSSRSGTVSVVGGGLTRRIPITQGGSFTGQWQEDFSLPDGTASDQGATAWSASRASGTFEVQEERFHINGKGGEGIWKSEPLVITDQASVTVSLDVQGAGSLNDKGKSADYLQVVLKVDGNETVIFSETGNFNDGNILTVSKNSVSGDTLQVIVKALVTGNSEMYYWDNVRISSNPTDLPGANLIKNGEFAAGTSDWRLLTYGTRASLEIATDTGLSGDEAAQVVITDGGSADWRIQLQQIVTLEQGKRYQLSFQGKADAERALRVAFQANSAPFPVYWEKSLTLSGEAQTYGPYEFTYQGTGEVGLKFFGGGDSTNFYLDAITLTEFDDDTNQGKLPWQEDFALADGTTSDEGATAWKAARTAGIFRVDESRFRINDDGGEGSWYSEKLDISGQASVAVSLDLQGIGSLNDRGKIADYLKVILKVDGSETVLFSEKGNFNNGNVLTVSKTDVSGDTLQVIVSALVTGDSESYYWDNVTVTGNGDRPSADNLVKNGEFEEGTTDWQLLTYGASAALEVATDAGLSGTPSAKVLVTDGGSADWRVQLAQTVPLDSGKTYELSFQGKADAQRAVRVGFQANVAPYSVYWEKSDTLGTETQTYGPYRFTYRGIDNVGLKFFVGKDSVDFYLDAITLTEVLGSETARTSSASADVKKSVEQAAETVQLYPNPASTSLTVAAAGTLQVRISDTQGRLFETVVGRDRVAIDVQVLPRGLYLVRIQSAEGVTVRRIVVE